MSILFVYNAYYLFAGGDPFAHEPQRVVAQVADTVKERLGEK